MTKKAENGRTEIEKACEKLVSVDNFVREEYLKGRKLTGTSVRSLITKIKLGEKTTEEAGFIPHRIAGKYFLEPK